VFRDAATLHPRENHAALEAPVYQRMSMWDAETALAQTLNMAFVLPVSKFVNVDQIPTAAGQAWSRFLNLLAKAYPNVKCRPSLKTLWSANLERSPGWKEVKGNWTLCDRPWTDFRLGWKQCAGTFRGQRGYSCGLWLLFHSLAVNLPKEEPPEFYAEAMQVIRSYIRHFFNCEACKKHFLEFSKNVEKDVSSHKTANMWLWDMHNIVNRRVWGIENKYKDGDPMHPKIAYPPISLCPTCRFPSVVKSDQNEFGSLVVWNFPEVYSWLVQYFTLPGDYKGYEANTTATKLDSSAWGAFSQTPSDSENPEDRPVGDNEKAEQAEEMFSVNGHHLFGYDHEPDMIPADEMEDIGDFVVPAFTHALPRAVPVSHSHAHSGLEL